MNQPNPSHCKHEYDDKDKTCQYPVFQDGLCIFHLPKFSNEEKKNIELKEKFLEVFIPKLQEWNKTGQVDIFNFEGFYFPNIDWTEAELKSKVNFYHSNKRVNFSFANFQHTNFDGTDFWWVDFVGTKFEKEANFRQTEFSKANFNGATFFQSAFFNKANFKGASFEGSKFQKVDFSKVRIAEKVEFNGEDSAGCFSNESNFSYLRFVEKGQIVFTKTFLGGASFRGTDLTRIVFNDVIWGRKPIFRKKMLIDELQADTPEKFLSAYQEIYDNYHQLVKIYSAKREFETAEDFHVGEMEMRRKRIWAEATPRWRRLRSIFNSFLVYKLLSYYGTSYWQALLVLCLMLLAASWVFLISGFQAFGSTQPINYDIFTLSFGRIQVIPWSDIKEAISFTLSILPFQRGQDYIPLGLCTQILKVIAVLVFSSQFALILLAVRRRFKRE